MYPIPTEVGEWTQWILLWTLLHVSSSLKINVFWMWCLSKCFSSIDLVVWSLGFSPSVCSAAFAKRSRNCLVIQWLGLCTSTVEGPGFDPLAAELTSCKPHSVASKKKKKKSPHLCHGWHNLPELTPGYYSPSKSSSSTHTPFSAKSKMSSPYRDLSA